jgi:hypothetical protein
MVDNYDLLIEDNFGDLASLNSSLKPENLLILHLNVRSLNMNFEKLELFVANLSVKPDVLICSETWLLSCFTFFAMKNYDCYYNHSSINRADGVVMYVKKSLQSTSTIEVIGNLKIVATTIKLKNNKSIKISGVYRCHDANKEIFIKQISDYIDNYNHGKNHIIAGDFNINLQDTDAISNLFISTFLDGGYLPYFNGITRPSESGGSCIDNFFIKTNYDDIKSFTYTNVFTDHYPMFISLGVATNNSKINKEVSVLNYKHLANLSNQTNWSSLIEVNDPDEFFDIFIDKIESLINDSTFVTKKKMCNNKPRSNWITKGIMKSCKTKEMLYRVTQNSRAGLDGHIPCRILRQKVLG